MAIENQKKKQLAEIEQHKSKGLNRFLWLIAIVLVGVIAVGNLYVADIISTPLRVVVVIIAMLITLGVVGLTNQGAKARKFLSESKTELHRISWPTRQETTQTTLIVMGVTVAVSLVLWGFDSVIVFVIKFLTDLRF